MKIFLSCTIILLAIFTIHDRAYSWNSIFHELSQSAMYEKAEDINYIVSSLSSCGESPYPKEKTESIVYNVLITAYNREDSDKSLIKDVFTYDFSCLNSAKDLPEYSKLINLLSASEQLRFCDPNYQRYYVRSPYGGIIRANPSIESKRLGVIPPGKIVQGIIENEEWIKIVSRWGDGYMLKSVFTYRRWELDGHLTHIKLKGQQGQSGFENSGDIEH